MQGDEFAGFRLECLLGRPGSFGQTWKAERDSETFALKIFHANLVESVEELRFEREVRALEKLSHPNLVDCADSGIERYGDLDVHWIAMPFIEGRNLAEELSAAARGVLPPARACLIVKQMALGLDALHTAGIVHRDVKPLNTLITSGGTVKLLDFGLARFLDYTTLTERGVVMGTVAYAAPEQLRGEAIPASDIYSLGVTLYELVAGRRPFTGDLVELVRAIQEDVPEPPSAFNPAVPAELDALVLELLAKEPMHRPATASEVAEELKPTVVAAPPARPTYRRASEPIVLARVGDRDVDDFANACLHGDAPTGVVVGITERTAFPIARRAAHYHDAKFAVDPLVLRTGLSNFSRTKALKSLPYSPDGLSPWQPGDFRSLESTQEFARRVVDEQVRCGADIILSPSFYFATLDDPWLGRNARLLEDALAARDAHDTALPLFATIACSFEPLCHEDALLALVNRLRRGRPDGFYLMLDGVEAPGTEVQLIFTLRLALLLQDLGVPAIVARAGSLRHFMLACGVGGVEVGLGRLNGFRMSDLTRKPGGPGRIPVRFEFPSLLTSLPREKAYAVLASGVVPEAACGCAVCSSGGSLEDRLEASAEHNLAMLRRERVELAGISVQDRIERVRAALARARAISRRLRILKAWDAPVQHLTVWEDALTEVERSGLLEPGRAARRRAS